MEHRTLRARQAATALVIVAMMAAANNHDTWSLNISSSTSETNASVRLCATASFKNMGESLKKPLKCLRTKHTQERYAEMSRAWL